MQRKHGGEYCVSTLTSAFYFLHHHIPSFVYYEVVYPFLKLISVSSTSMHCSLHNVLNNAHDPLAINTLITIICYENALFIFAKMLRNTLDRD